MMRTIAADPQSLRAGDHADRPYPARPCAQARDAGVNEFIAKPVSVKTMMPRLVAVIENPRPYVRTKGYFGPCRRRRGAEEYRGPERRAEAASSRQRSRDHGPPATHRTVHAAQHAEGQGRRRAGRHRHGARSSAPKRAMEELQRRIRRLAGRGRARRWWRPAPRLPPRPDAAARAALLRAAHDIKGQAATFNYPLIARVAGSLSRLIGELPDRRRSAAGAGGCACQRHPGDPSRKAMRRDPTIAWRRCCAPNWTRGSSEALT